MSDFLGNFPVTNMFEVHSILVTFPYWFNNTCLLHKFPGICQIKGNFSTLVISKLNCSRVQQLFNVSRHFLCHNLNMNLSNLCEVNWSHPLLQNFLLWMSPQFFPPSQGYFQHFDQEGDSMIPVHHHFGDLKIWYFQSQWFCRRVPST